MLEFRRSKLEGYNVYFDEERIGYITRNSGFVLCVDDIIKRYTYILSDDLREIADKADELQEHGDNLPICIICRGTPDFPEKIRNSKKAETRCRKPIHSRAICI